MANLQATQSSHQASTGNLKYFTNEDGEVEYHDEIHDALHTNARVDYTKPIIRNGNTFNRFSRFAVRRSSQE